MVGTVSELSPTDVRDLRRRLVELYDTALDDVYGYLARRSESVTAAEELTSETFLAAADAVVHRPPVDLTVAWLIGIARHKLGDHWRRRERERRLLTAIDAQPGSNDDVWDVELDRITAHAVLRRLGPHHRGALTLRYVDGLPVREVAACLGRTEKATEVLLVRARAAFRVEYESQGGRP
jgi:RNA polymerase sigma-70 factor (ECF subfamily)